MNSNWLGTVYTQKFSKGDVEITHYKLGNTLANKPLDEIYCQGEAPVCGNGIVESKEACDGGIQCSNDCKTKCADNEVWKNGTCEVPTESCKSTEVWNGLACLPTAYIKSTKNFYNKNEGIEFDVSLPESTTKYYLHLTTNPSGFDIPLTKYVNIYWEMEYAIDVKKIYIDDIILLHSGNLQTRKLYYRIDALYRIEMDQSKRLSNVGQLTFETRRIPSDMATIKLDSNALQDLSFPYPEGTEVYTCQGQNMTGWWTHNPSNNSKFKYALDLMVDANNAKTALTSVYAPIDGIFQGFYYINQDELNRGAKILKDDVLIEIDHMQDINIDLQYGMKIEKGTLLGITTQRNLGGCVHLHIHMHDASTSAPVPLEYGRWNLKTDQIIEQYHGIYIKF
jgi:hypothetical protein